MKHTGGYVNNVIDGGMISFVVPQELTRRLAEHKGNDMSTTVLIENVELLENTLNEDARTVDVVLIRPGWSKNGRYYSRAVLAQAADSYNNKFAFDGHQSMSDMKKGVARKVGEATGRYFRAHIGPDGELCATRKVYDNPAGLAVWPVIKDAAMHPGEVEAGLSHTAIGKTSKGEAEGRRGDIVEGIASVISIDDVVSPAAGGEYTALVADTNSLTAAILESLSYDEWVDSRPDYAESLKKQNQRARQTEQEREARTQLEEAQQQIATLNAQLTALTEEKRHAISDANAAREEASRAEQQVALERAFRSVALPADTEQELREEMEGKPLNECLEILERTKRLARAVKPRSSVTGLGQRVHSTKQVARVTESAPIDMDVFDTPEKLLAEQKRRAAARAQGG